jgi:class 3 adenylate cyclase
VARIPAEEIADLVPCELSNVHRLAELGILTADEVGLYPSSDVHLVRLVAAFEEAGIPVEDVARGISSGELSYPLELFMPEPEEARETFEELAARVGRPAELLRRLSREFGFPPRDDDRVRVGDAELLCLFVDTVDLADEEELSRFARLYGGTMQRLVASGIQFFDRAVRQRVLAQGLPDNEADRIIYGRGAEYTEVVRQLVPWLQRRHREHGLSEYLVGLTEGWLEERNIAPRPARQPPAIAFLDLTGYTALVEERGDEAAAEVAADLAGVVKGTAEAHGGRPVKWLGDGVMFHYGDPAGAVIGGVELVEETERAISVPARIGISAGPVIVQEGDYFGRTVNIAARIADYAQASEVLVSEEAKRCAHDAGLEFELVGDVELKGVSRPVRLHKAIRR